MKIPSNNQWTQLNDGDIFGVLHETQNINFDRQGTAKLAKKTAAVYDSGEDADFGLLMATAYFSGDYYFVTDEKVFSGDFQGGGISEVAGGPTVSVRGDAVVYDSKLYVTIDDQLTKWAALSWTVTGLYALTSGVPHPMCIFDSNPTYKLAIGNGSTVAVLNTSLSAGQALTLPDQARVTSLAYRNGFLYVGTRDLKGGEASLYIWNGDSGNANYSIPVGASYIYAVVPYRGTVALITNEGELLAVEGTGVRRLGALPIFYKQGARWEEFSASNGKVNKNGMTVIGDNIYINVNGKVDVGAVDGMKSGIWCYDPAVGLYHMASFSTDKVVSDSGVTQSSSVLTTSAAHNLKLGDAVTFSSVSGITGISDDVIYYAIPVTTTTLKIAGSLANAFAGENMTLSGTATTDTIHYAPNTDYGDLAQTESGAISVTHYIEPQWNFYNSELYFGYNAGNNSGTDTDCLGMLMDSWNVGSITTQSIFAKNVTEVWSQWVLFLKGILGSTEKLIIKYRSENRQSFPSKQVSVTWTDSDTFTCTDNAVYNLIEADDEVVFYDGYGQGRTAHVTSVSFASGTATVNIDESIGNATDTATVIFSGFKKIQEFDYTRENPSFVAADLGGRKDTLIQLKVEMRGYEPEILVTDLQSKPNIVGK